MSVDAALDRTDLAALLTELAGQPTHAGAGARWRCVQPSHDDENPSTTVFTDQHGRERYRCWSCGDCGTAIDALMAARSMSIGEAIRTLEERSNTTDTPQPRQARPPRRSTGPIGLSSEARDYIEQCAERLWRPEGADARRWLVQRGLTDVEVLRANQVGFDPGHRNLRRAAGLPGNISFERDGRARRLPLPGGTGVTFPAFDRTGTPVHVQTRLLNPGRGGFKYVNPRRQHGSIPAASFPIEPTPRPAGLLLVTEGTPDGLIALTAGFRVATVTSSTTVRQSTADEISEHASGGTIVLAFDNDDAGRAATTALRPQLAGDVRVLRLPAGEDLTSTYNPRSNQSWHDQTAPLTTAQR